MNKSPKRKITPPYMCYNTYVILRAYLEREKEILHKEFCVATAFTHELKYEDHQGHPPKLIGDKNHKVQDKMWKNYCKWLHYHNDMLAQLEYAFSKGAHPNVVANGMFENPKSK